MTATSLNQNSVGNMGYCGLLPRLLLKIISNFWMSAIVGPACGRPANFRVFDVHVCALFDQELNHRPMAVECRVMQARAGIIKTSGDRVDLCTFLYEEFRSTDVAVHA